MPSMPQKQVLSRDDNLGPQRCQHEYFKPKGDWHCFNSGRTAGSAGMKLINTMIKSSPTKLSLFFRAPKTQNFHMQIWQTLIIELPAVQLKDSSERFQHFFDPLGFQVACRHINPEGPAQQKIGNSIWSYLESWKKDIPKSNRAKQPWIMNRPILEPPISVGNIYSHVAWLHVIVVSLARPEEPLAAPKNWAPGPPACWPNLSQTSSPNIPKSSQTISQNSKDWSWSTTLVLPERSLLCEPNPELCEEPIDLSRGHVFNWKKHHVSSCYIWSCWYLMINDNLAFS